MTQVSTDKVAVFNGFELRRKQPGQCKLRCVIDMDSGNRKDWGINLNNSRQTCQRRIENACPFDVVLKEE